MNTSIAELLIWFFSAFKKVQKIVQMLEYSEYLLHSLFLQAFCDFVYASARALFSQGGQDFGEKLSRPAPFS